MDLPCEIIKDLLPLYAEEMASHATAQVVEKHLAHCRSCSTELQAMKKQVPVPQYDLKPLARIRRDLKKKKCLTAVLATAILAVILLSVFSFLSSPQYLPNTEDLFQVVEYSDRDAIIIFHDGITSYKATRDVDIDGNVYVDIMAWSSILDRFLGKDAPCYRIPADANMVFYCSADPHDDNTIIWSNIKTDFAGKRSLASLSLSYLAIISAALVLIFGILLMVFRKRSGVFVVLRNVGGIPLSYLCAYICIKGFTTISFFPIRDFAWIIAVMVFWYAALFSGCSMLPAHPKSSRKFF